MITITPHCSQTSEHYTPPHHPCESIEIALFPSKRLLHRPLSVASDCNPYGLRHTVFIMPSNQTCPAILHVRDFVEHVERDPTRPGRGLALQLRLSLNIPQKNETSGDVQQQDTPVLIRFFCDQSRFALYQPNTFIYASGSFLTTSTEDTGFHILLHAHSVDRCV